MAFACSQRSSPPSGRPGSQPLYHPCGQSPVADQRCDAGQRLENAGGRKPRCMAGPHTGVAARQLPDGDGLASGQKFTCQDPRAGDDPDSCHTAIAARGANAIILPGRNARDWKAMILASLPAMKPCAPANGLDGSTEDMARRSPAKPRGRQDDLAGSPEPVAVTCPTSNSWANPSSREAATGRMQRPDPHRSLESLSVTRQVRDPSHALIWPGKRSGSDRKISLNINILNIKSGSLRSRQGPVPCHSRRRARKAAPSVPSSRWSSSPPTGTPWARVVICAWVSVSASAM